MGKMAGQSACAEENGASIVAEMKIWEQYGSMAATEHNIIESVLMMSLTASTVQSDLCEAWSHIEWRVLPPETMLMSVDHAASEGGAGISGPAATRGRVGLCGPCYHRRPCDCPWSVPPEALSVSGAAAPGHANVHSLGFCRDHDGVCEPYSS